MLPAICTHSLCLAFAHTGEFTRRTAVLCVVTLPGGEDESGGSVRQAGGRQDGCIRACQLRAQHHELVVYFIKKRVHASSASQLSMVAVSTSARHSCTFWRYFVSVLGGRCIGESKGESESHLLLSSGGTGITTARGSNCHTWLVLRLLVQCGGALFC